MRSNAGLERLALVAAPLEAIQVDGGPPGVNHYDVGGKKKGVHQPQGSGHLELEAKRRIFNVPFLRTMTKAYNVESRQAIQAEKACREIAERLFPGQLQAVFLSTLLTVFGRVNANKIAEEVAQWVMRRWCECNGTFCQRIKLTNPANWVTFLGFHPTYIQQFELILRRTEKETTELFPWKTPELDYSLATA